MKTPDQNFNSGNNEGAPKDPFVQEINRIKDGILSSISELQSGLSYPQNLETYKADLLKEAQKNIGLIEEIEAEYKSKAGAEYLISTTNMEFASKKMSEAFSIFTDKSIENMKNSSKIFEQIHELRKSSKSFLETIKDNSDYLNIKEFFDKQEDNYLSLLADLNEERSKLNHALIEMDLEKSSSLLSNTVNEGLDETKIDEHGKELLNKMENVLKNFTQKCQEINQSIINLISPTNNN